MKKILAILILILSVAASAFADKQVIAVWDIVNSSGNRLGNKVAQDFKAELTTALVNSGIFLVVERGQLESVLREFSFQQTGMVDSDTAIEIGRMSGAGLTFVGNVVTANVGPQDNFLYKSIKAKVKLNYKIIDNETGIIKASEMVEGNTSVMVSQRPNPDLLMFNAVREAVEKVTEVLTGINHLSGSIMKISDKKVYINVGGEQGVKKGDTFIIYKEGETLVDPASGDILGVEEEEIGTMKIEEVMPKYAVAKVKKCSGKLTQSMKVRKAKKK